MTLPVPALQNIGTRLGARAWDGDRSRVKPTPDNVRVPQAAPPTRKPSLAVTEAGPSLRRMGPYFEAQRATVRARVAAPLLLLASSKTGQALSTRLAHLAAYGLPFGGERV